jgi:hypothetical protein
MVLAWHNYGGGKALLDEIYKSLNMDVVSYLYGPMPTQPLGWFKKPVAKVEDMKGLKFRTVGLAVDVFTEHGRGGQPAARRRDRAGAGPRPDRRGRVQQRLVRPRAGLPRRGQELHAAELPPERRAVRDPVQQGQVRRPARRAEGHHRLRRAGRQRRHELEGDRPQLQGLHRAETKAGVKFYKTPDAILRRSSTPGTRSLPRRRARTRCSRRCSIRRRPLPSVPASGRTTTWSTSRWPTTTTSAARRPDPACQPTRALTGLRHCGRGPYFSMRPARSALQTQDTMQKPAAGRRQAIHLARPALRLAPSSC